jgi:hypothetical protein
MAGAMGNQLLQRLQQIGVAPPNARRVIIDARINEVLAVYYECFGDQATMEIARPEVFDQALTLHVEDLSDK